MPLPRAFLILGAAAVLSGCATLTKEEAAGLRARGVREPVVRKMDRGDALTPPELVTLAKRDVPDGLTLRYLDDVGVDYLVTREDVRRLRRGGVSARVIDALLEECADFARDYAPPEVSFSLGYTNYFWDAPLLFGPSLYYPYW